MQIGLRARDIAQADVPARNLVFLIDVSGSMQSDDKLPLLKRGMAMLIRQLRPQDRMAMVVYAGASSLALPSTPGSEKDRMLEALGALEAGGSTNGADGIALAYNVARAQFVRGGINRVDLHDRLTLALLQLGHIYKCGIEKTMRGWRDERERKLLGKRGIGIAAL